MVAGTGAGPRHAAAALAAGALDFVALEPFEAQRARLWGTLAGSGLAAQGPTLFAYSWDDPIADPLRWVGLRGRGARCVGPVGGCVQCVRLAGLVGLVGQCGSDCSPPAVVVCALRRAGSACFAQR